MKNLIILIIIIAVLILANILFNNKNLGSKSSNQSLANAINLKEDLSSFEILKNDHRIKIVKRNSCFEILDIYYCAENKKIQFLNNFLNSDVIDVYDKTEDDLKRLGFNNNEYKRSIIINNKKTLFFGNINKYNEIYVLQSNKIYKIEYDNEFLEVTTRFWLDKSAPLIPLKDTDEFDINITRYIVRNSEIVDKSTCVSLDHKEITLTTKHSSLRNSFLDLYPLDLMRAEKIKDFESYDIMLTNSISGELIKILGVYKEEHLTYGKINNRHDLKFVIANSVYENVKSYCK